LSSPVAQPCSLFFSPVGTPPTFWKPVPMARQNDPNHGNPHIKILPTDPSSPCYVTPSSVSPDFAHFWRRPPHSNRRPRTFGKVSTLGPPLKPQNLWHLIAP
jgi:hypothetical protein